MSSRLGLHVIGPCLGESVVVELPDGGVGVIDSFAGRDSSPHPVIEFIQGRWSTLTELRFFAVTHPHADHCHRAAELCDKYPPKEYWVFRPFPLGQLREYYSAIERLGARDQVEKACELPAGSVIHSLLKLEKQISDRKKVSKWRYLGWGHTFDLCGGQVRVHFLTPGHQKQLAYAQDIARMLKGVTIDGVTVEDIDRLSEPKHNMASGAIMIEYGKSRALLMADAEDELWDEWYECSPPLMSRQKVHYIKASHHGSTNGYHNKLYTEVGDPRKTVAVITPFNQGRAQLPAAAGIVSLRAHVNEVYCTNRNLAIRSTSLSWKPAAPRPMPGLPGDWLREIRANPGLSKFFAAGVVPFLASGRRPASIPPHWAIRAKREPKLWHLFEPTFREPIPGLAPAEEYTISVYLSDSGRIVDRQAGNGTGILS